MAITNGYCTLAEARSALGYQTSVTTDDSRIESLVQAASRRIESHCARQFWLEGSASARYYTAEYGDLLLVDDIGSTTGLTIKSDEDGNRVYEITWTASDYDLEPFGGKRYGESVAYDQIATSPLGSRAFPAGIAYGVEVTARWGWPAVPDTIREATILQTVRWFKRKDAPFGVTGAPETGLLTPVPALDPDIRDLLWRYVRIDTPRRSRI